MHLSATIFVAAFVDQEESLWWEEKCKTKKRNGDAIEDISDLKYSFFWFCFYFGVGLFVAILLQEARIQTWTNRICFILQAENRSSLFLLLVFFFLGIKYPLFLPLLINYGNIISSYLVNKIMWMPLVLHH